MSLNFESAKLTEIGQKLVADPDGYKPEVAALLLKLINKRKAQNIFLDIGSNIGYFPLLSAEFAKENEISLEIYAHEPFPEIGKFAKKLMVDNDLFYHLDDCAVSDAEGGSKFYLSSKSDASNSLNPAFRKNKGVIEVKTSTIDNLYYNVTQDFSRCNVVLMIDVETYEPQVLRGALEFIKRYRPAIICKVLAGRAERDLENILGPLGYMYFKFDGECWVKEGSIYGDSSYKFRDWLFICEDHHFYNSSRIEISNSQVAKMSPPIFASGYIKDGNVCVSFAFEGSIGDSYVLRFIGISTVVSHTVSISNVSICETSDNIKTIESRYKIPSGVTPLIRVEVTINGRDVCYADHWYLSELYPVNDDRFRALFYRRKSRVKAYSTLMYSLSQTLDCYDTKLTNKAVLAVIYAYRLLDFGDIKSMGQHCDYIKELIVSLPFVNDAEHPRKNSSHQIASLYSVYVLMLIAQGLYDDMIDVLNNYKKILDNMDESSYFGVIFNGCNSMLLFVVIRLITGNHSEAKKLIDLIVTLYLQFIPKVPRSAIYFDESRFILNCVVMSLEIQEKLDGGRKLPDALEIFRMSHRVNSESGKVFLDGAFSRIWKSIRIARRTNQSDALGSGK